MTLLTQPVRTTMADYVIEVTGGYQGLYLDKHDIFVPFDLEKYRASGRKMDPANIFVVAMQGIVNIAIFHGIFDDVPRLARACTFRVAAVMYCMLSKHRNNPHFMVLWRDDPAIVEGGSTGWRTLLKEYKNDLEGVMNRMGIV